MQRLQRSLAALVAAVGAGVLGLSAGGIGAIDRDLEAAAAKAPAVTTERVELQLDCDWDGFHRAELH